ncbi:MAG: sulfatase-like hydrolase/transferase [Christensenellales bacterium]
MAAYVGIMTPRFIKESQEEPFVLYLNFFKPHVPFYSPSDDYCDWTKMPLPANYVDFPGEDFPYKNRALSLMYQTMYKTYEDWKRLISRYYGQITMADRQIGKIMQAIEQSGQLDKTVIIYTSDHGDMMGSHKLSAKGVMYE